jgi:hypothetical protein
VLIAFAFFTALLGAGLAGLIGVCVSQYAPVFGNYSARSEPWSEARQHLMMGHLLAFGLVGLFLGALSGPALAYICHYVFRSLWDD